MIPTTPAVTQPSSFRTIRIQRWILLALILLAFARLTWQLDGKALWWDESLSLQRAESSWGDLVLGKLIITDGIHQNTTIDQHPFTYFIVLGLMIRLAGISEFALRFPSVMAATLMVPAVWVLARYLVRRGAVPASTPLWGALFAALNPFLLWYGQEARMYAQVALLAVLSVYAILCWANRQRASQARGLGDWGRYSLITAAFITSHYFSVLLLPVHAVIIYRRLVKRNRRLAIGAAVALLIGGGLLALAASWIILRQPGSGTNFARVAVFTLLPDLLNAYSLGLSVNIDDVRWLDAIFAGILLLGIVQGYRVRAKERENRWLGLLLPMFLLVPPLLLLLINYVRPSYMNARHMSLIAGGFVLVLGAGTGWLWRQRSWIGGAVAALLVAGMLYSTRNYFVDPRYQKDDFPGLGAYLSKELQPGDLLLLNPPELLRLYRYYLPVDQVGAGKEAGLNTEWQNVPLLCDQCPHPQLYPLLDELRQKHQRIWLVSSGMFPFSDPEKQIERWLQENAFRVRERNFLSTSSYLGLDLFLPQQPLVNRLPDTATVVNAQFGEEIALLGYEMGRPFHRGAVYPLTLYWKSLGPVQSRYKYIVQLVKIENDTVVERFSPTEREPYDGFLPTVWWPADGSLVRELSELDGPEEMPIHRESYRIELQVYDSESWAKLEITSSQLGQIEENVRILLPLPSLNE